jgi:hypothetical protein
MAAALASISSAKAISVALAGGSRISLARRRARAATSRSSATVWGRGSDGSSLPCAIPHYKQPLCM